ncbi:MAG TPA: hypothetical protein ENN73_04495, partial [Firmicutes bacterium]|nr:hypothetical protein [Bacillota bacterium]
AYDLVESKILNEKRYDYLQFFYNMHFSYSCGNKSVINESFLKKYWWYSKQIEILYFEYLFKHRRLESEMMAAKIEVTNNPKDIEKIYFIAKGSMWLSEFEDAVPHFEELQNLAPSNPKFLEPLSKLYESFDKPKESAEIYKKIIRQEPLNKNTYIIAGDILAEAGYIEEAVEIYKDILNINRRDANLYKELAAIYFDFEKFREATEVIDKIRLILNDDFLYAKEQAALYEQMDDNPRAIVEYLRVLINYYDTGATASTSVYKQGYYDYDDSYRYEEYRDNYGEEYYGPVYYDDYYYNDDYYERLDTERIRTRLVYLANQKGLTDEIVLQFYNFISKDTGAGSGYYELGLFYLGINLKDKAMGVFVKGLKRVTSKYYHDQVIKIFKEQEEYRLLDEEYKRLIGCFPSDLSVYYDAVAYFKLREDQAAVEDVLQNMTKNFPEKFDLGFFYKSAENNKKAVKEFERLLSVIEPEYTKQPADHTYRRNYIIILENLSDLYVKVNKLNQAYETFDKLIALEPDNVTHIIQRFRITVKHGDAKEGEEFFRKHIAEYRNKERKDRRSYSYLRVLLHNEFIRYFTEKKNYKTALQFYKEMIEIDPLDRILVHEAFSFSKKYGLYENLFEHFRKYQDEQSRDYRIGYAVYLLAFYNK